ncbi:hypothetical protein diail_824 [Diaporthe ilicicola]|nr:hypothetical protein diail_824 [Diaporthe ilicicola]
MERGPGKAVSTNEMWSSLTDDLKQSVCDILVRYSGPDVDSFMNDLVKLASGKAPPTKITIQDATAGKRKRDDNDVVEPPRAPDKKQKPAEATISLQSADVNLVSPKIPLAWPSFRTSPIKFGQPTLSPSTVGGPLTATTPALTAPSSIGPATSLTSSTSPALPTASPFVKFAKANKSVQPASDCDEQFTFADRRSSPQPHAGPGRPHRLTPTAEQILCGQPQSKCPTTQSQKIPKPTTHTGSFDEVDNVSPNIPANSNASVKTNPFETPSGSQQGAGKVAPRKVRLKCVQCQELYYEHQNVGKNCRRHPGYVVGVYDKRLRDHTVPIGAEKVWTCCRRESFSRGCYRCKHHAA